MKLQEGSSRPLRVVHLSIVVGLLEIQLLAMVWVELVQVPAKEQALFKCGYVPHIILGYHRMGRQTHSTNYIHTFGIDADNLLAEFDLTFYIGGDLHLLPQIP